MQDTVGNVQSSAKRRHQVYLYKRATSLLLSLHLTDWLTDWLQCVCVCVANALCY